MSETTFRARGKFVWLCKEVEGEFIIAEATTPEWAREIAEAMRGFAR